MKTNNIKASLLSPLATSAIGVIALVGEDSESFLSQRFSKPLPENNCFVLGMLLDDKKNPLDQVLIARSGESFEITSHGGVRLIERILDSFVQSDCRLASADEISTSASSSENPATCEAYRILPHAKTTLAVKFLLHQAHSGLSEFFRGQSPAFDSEQKKKALRYRPQINYLLTGASAVILGAPNSGKSTLLNALSGFDHALVADFPGTTRDYVQVQLDLGGLPVTLHDTAGIGNTDDPLYEKAKECSIALADSADVAIILLDADQPLASKQFLNEISSFPIKRKMYLINKIDLAEKATLDIEPDSAIGISALKNINLDKIPHQLKTCLGLDLFDPYEPTVFSETLQSYFE